MLPQFISIAGIFLSVLLIYYNFKKKPQIVFIGLFFAFLSAYTYFHYVMIYSQNKVLVAIVFVQLTFVGYLIGPMLYFYIRSVLKEQKLFRKIDLLHFIPALYYLIASVPYVILPWKTKLEIASKIINDQNLFWQASIAYLNWLIPIGVNYPSRPILLFLYSAFSLFLLVRQKQLLLKTSSNHHMDYQGKWLMILLGFLGMFSILQSAMVVYSVVIEDSILFHTNNVFQIFSGIALLIIMLVPFFFPSVLYGIPSTPIDRSFTRMNSDVDDKVNTLFGQKAEMHLKKIIPEFEPQYIEHIKNEVSRHMEEEKCYLAKDCNLQSFARTINIPAHHLLYFFKEVKGQSFNDFKNHLRVQHAKILMEENSNMLFTMEAIGALSGFTSKNAFYVAFNKFEGCTPGVYIEKKQLRK